MKKKCYYLCNKRSAVPSRAENILDEKKEKKKPTKTTKPQFSFKGPVSNGALRQKGSIVLAMNRQSICSKTHTLSDPV